MFYPRIPSCYSEMWTFIYDLSYLIAILTFNVQFYVVFQSFGDLYSLSWKFDISTLYLSISTVYLKKIFKKCESLQSKWDVLTRNFNIYKPKCLPVISKVWWFYFRFTALIHAFKVGGGGRGGVIRSCEYVKEKEKEDVLPIMAERSLTTCNEVMTQNHAHCCHGDIRSRESFNTSSAW